MSTTHKATPYARTMDIDKAHELGFYFTDYPLSYSLGLEIAEALGESLTSGNYGDDISEIIHSTLDSVMPVYNFEILKEWQEANCPEPDDEEGTIWAQMTNGLYQAMYDFASGVLYTSTDDLEEALERLNTIYPYKEAN